MYYLYSIINFLFRNAFKGYASVPRRYASVPPFMYFDLPTREYSARVLRPFSKSGLIGRSNVLVEVKSVGRSTEKVELMRIPFKQRI